MANLINDKKIYIQIGEKLNEHFGTLIPIDETEDISYLSLQSVYDIYPSVNAIIEDTDLGYMDIPLKNIKKNPLYYKIDENVHVIFNDYKYDFVTHAPDMNWESGEKEKYRTLQLQQGLITENQLEIIKKIENNYAKMLEEQEQEM